MNIQAVSHRFRSVRCFVREIFEEMFHSSPGGDTPLFGLYGDVPLDRVWFFGLAVLNRVYNLTCLCAKQGMVLRAERL